MIVGPFEREAPSEVLSALRSVHPSATLLYFGEGVWGPGIVEPSDARTRQADRILRTLDRAKKVKRGSPEWAERSKQYLWALAMRQGFAQTAHFVIQGEPDSRIVEDFRSRRYAYENSVPYDDWKALRDAEKRSNRDEMFTDPARYREADRWLRGRHSVLFDTTLKTA